MLTNKMTKILNFLFAFLICNFFITTKLLPQQDNTKTPAIQSQQITPQQLDSLSKSLTTQIEEIKKANQDKTTELAKENLEMAGKIIDWSAALLAGLAVLLVIAGLIGLKEFSDIRKTEKRMEEMEKRMQTSLADIETELASVKDYKTNLVKETKTFIEVNYYLNAGIQAYQRGNYLIAKENCYKVLDLDSNHITAHYFIAKSLMMEFHEDEADTMFHKILAIDATNAETYYGLALNHADRHPQKAIEYCQKAIELDPQHLYAHNFLGLIYMNEEEIDKALEVLLKCRAIRETTGNSFSVGLIYYAKGESEKAKRYFDESNYLAQKQIERTDSQWHWQFFMMGVIEGLYGDVERAKVLINKALDYNSAKKIRSGMVKNLEFLNQYVNNSRIDILIKSF